MNPLFEKIVGSLVRHFMSGLAIWLIANIGISEASAMEITMALGTAIIAAAWGAWEKYRTRQKLVTALASTEPMSEKQVERLVKNGVAPPATVRKDAIPY